MFRTAIRPSRNLAYTTVMTIMDRLYQKGFLSRTLRSRTHLYEPAIDFSDVRDEAVELLIQNFFGSKEKLQEFLEGRTGVLAAASPRRPPLDGRKPGRNACCDAIRVSLLEEQVVEFIAGHAEFLQDVVAGQRGFFTNFCRAADHDHKLTERLHLRPDFGKPSEEKFLMNFRDLSRDADFAVTQYLLHIFERRLDAVGRFVENQSAPRHSAIASNFCSRAFFFAGQKAREHELIGGQAGSGEGRTAAFGPGIGTTRMPRWRHNRTRR